MCKAQCHKGAKVVNFSVNCAAIRFGCTEENSAGFILSQHHVSCHNKITLSKVESLKRDLKSPRACHEMLK